MVATQPILKGHEIFNTYGQMANWQLIHMYGFAEPYPNNTDDTADIQMVTVREAALQGTEDETERLLLRERWDFLCKQELVGEEGAFVIGREEVLTEEELATTLKISAKAVRDALKTKFKANTKKTSASSIKTVTMSSSGSGLKHDLLSLQDE